MLITEVHHPITDGILVDYARTALTAWSGLVVQRKLPTMTARRMVTFRNDSGPIEGSQSRRRYGVNIWADDLVDAENLALDLMAALRLTPGTGPITAMDQFTGPLEIDDDVPLTHDSKTLHHFYFTCRASIRGTASP